MLAKKDLLILSSLRKNAREKLTKMSKNIRVPISTIFDKLKTYQGRFICGHTTLLNFSELGYNTRAHILLKVEKHNKQKLIEFLENHHHVNSIAKINNGFDFMTEVIFVNIKELEEFVEKLEFQFDILDKEIHYIVEDIKKEAFMADPAMIDVVS